VVRGIGLVVVDRVGYLGRRPVPEQRSPDDRLVRLDGWLAGWLISRERKILLRLADSG